MRKAYPSTSHPSSFLNGDYTGPIPSRTELSETSTFTSCSFNTQGQGGGAIFFHDTLGSLTVSDSVFDKCNATSGHGGAMYCYNCGKISIKRSLFIECSALLDFSGGGVFVNSISALPEITENIFLSCSGGQDGGGLYFYQIHGGANGANLPVKKCRFIGCVANGARENSNVNDADCGGAAFWKNDYTLGLWGSLFVKCDSKFRVGAVGLCINTTRFDFVIRYCHFSDNTARYGNNVLVEFVGESESHWDIVFLHSFTTDKHRSNSLVGAFDDSWSPITVSDDWLPLGTLSYLNTWDGANDPYPDNDPEDGITNPTRFSSINGTDTKLISTRHFNSLSFPLNLPSRNA